MNFILRRCCRDISRKGILFNHQAWNAFEIEMCRAHKFTWINWDNRGVLKNMTDGGLANKIRYSASGFFFDFPFYLRKAVKKLGLFDYQKFAPLGVSWYASLDGVKTDDFLRYLEMPDTFYSWFKVIELHVWIILLYLRQDKENSKAVRRVLIECMWSDVSLRAKSFAPVNKNYKKDINHFTKHFRTILFAYDEGYLTDDKKLCSALWCYFFEKECDDPRNLEALVSYIRYQISYMEKLNLKNMNKIDGSIWMPFSAHILKECKT